MILWFYQFPGKIPLPIVGMCSTEREARAWIRRRHKISQVPRGTLMWPEETNSRVWKELRDSDAGVLVDSLIKAKIPHRLRTVEAVTGNPLAGRVMIIDLGPIKMVFDAEGQFVRMEWYEPEYNEGGGTERAYRGREHGQH